MMSMDNTPTTTAKKRERGKEMTLRIDHATYAALCVEAERQALPPRTLARAMLTKAFRQHE